MKDKQNEVFMDADRISQSARWLQLLNGRKLHVLMAMYVLRPFLPVGELEIAQLIGCHRGTVRTNLSFLLKLGLVAHGPRHSQASWTLTSEAYQLPLPISGNGGEDYAKEVRIAPLSVSSLSLSSSIPTLNSPLSEKKEKNSKPVRNPPLCEKPTEIGDELAEWLRRAGIWRTRWASFAALDWVTADYLRAHVLKAERDGDPPSWLATRISSGAPAPFVCPYCEDLFDWRKTYDEHVVACAQIER